MPQRPQTGRSARESLAAASQRALPGFEHSPRQVTPDYLDDNRAPLLGYKLFLALFPSPDDALFLAATASRLRDKLDHFDRWLPPERFHITLHTIADSDEPPVAFVVDAAKYVARQSSWLVPERLDFDHALTFAPDDRHPLVLRCTPEGDAHLAALRRALARSMRRVSLVAAESRTAHLTIAYGRPRIDRTSIPPISCGPWRLSLVLSHKGRRYHQRLND